jgi:hypothetical protein
LTSAAATASVENLPVLTADGLVGRVSSVGYTRSQVVLIGDPNCRVSALVENPAHDMGVISAGGPLDFLRCRIDLSFRQRQFETRPGRLTSGSAGFFPKAFPSARSWIREQVEFGLYTEARVKLNANLGALEQVWVLFHPHQLKGPNEPLQTILILAAAFLAVFGEAAAFPVFGEALPRHWLGAQVDLLPALMVYAALNTDIVTVSLLAVLGGLWFDALSANPLGRQHPAAVCRRLPDLSAARIDFARAAVRAVRPGRRRQRGGAGADAFCCC